MELRSERYGVLGGTVARVNVGAIRWVTLATRSRGRLTLVLATGV